MRNIYAKMLTAKRILQILSVCAVALLLFGWGTMPAVVAQEPQQEQSPGAQSPGAQSPDAQSPDAQSPNAETPEQSREPEPLHTIPIETLGTAINAMDSWAINCPSGTHHLHYDVRDYSSGGPTFGIVANDFNTGIATMRRASQGRISPSGTVTGGSGFYVLYVFKTGGSTALSGTYDSVQVCHTSGHLFLNHLNHYIFEDE